VRLEEPPGVVDDLVDVLRRPGKPLIPIRVQVGTGRVGPD